MRADSGRYTFRGIDRDGEIGAVHFPILRHHALQSELVGALARDRHADQSAAVHGHEIDRLRRRLFRRHDQVAFVFAVGVVGHDHHFAGGDVVQHLINCVELKGFGRLNDHPDTIAVAPALGNGN